MLLALFDYFSQKIANARDLTNDIIIDWAHRFRSLSVEILLFALFIGVNPSFRM